MGIPIQPWKLRQARRVFNRGGLIAYPTEAVYGLGCDPLNGQAVADLLELKSRPMAKGLILIAADFKQLSPYLARLPSELMRHPMESWPGPHTWIMPAAENTPDWLTGGRDTLAVRVTAHPVCRALCRANASAMVSTSANPSGHKPARDALTVRRLFKRRRVFVIAGSVGGLKRPTQIRNLLSGHLTRA